MYHPLDHPKNSLLLAIVITSITKLVNLKWSF